jgi:hypothetical protein
MIHALVLGLVIAIVLIILIQKVTSGFTAAECDARYTADYRACGDTYEKTQKGRATTSDKQKALRAKEACIAAAAATKITCLGPAAAAGDVVATKRLQDAQRQDRKTSSPRAVTGANRVTPGAALTPSAPRGGKNRDRGRGKRGSAAPAPSPIMAAPAPSQGNQTQVASPPPMSPLHRPWSPLHRPWSPLHRPWSPLHLLFQLQPRRLRLWEWPRVRRMRRR